MSSEIIILCIAAFSAGFIDSIVGGGGLVQTPATLITLPNHPIATLLGTTKIPAFAGTSIAAFQYAKRVVLERKLLWKMCAIALCMSFLGSATVALVQNNFMKPIMLVVLIIVAIYTFTKKNFGITVNKTVDVKKQTILSAIAAFFLGFYDGFFGPGTGSFLLLFFISTLGFDFLKASAHAKFVNLATNLGSILFFSTNGHVLYRYAIPMAICNISGSFFGSKLAILKGNKFIRIFFLLVIILTILRFAYDVFIVKH